MSPGETTLQWFCFHRGYAAPPGAGGQAFTGVAFVCPLEGEPGSFTPSLQGLLRRGRGWMRLPGRPALRRLPTAPCRPSQPPHPPEAPGSPAAKPSQDPAKPLGWFHPHPGGCPPRELRHAHQDPQSSAWVSGPRVT